MKGEITIIAGPPAATMHAIHDADVEAAIVEAMTHMPAAKAAAEIARRFNIAKKDVYARILVLKSETGD